MTKYRKVKGPCNPYTCTSPYRIAPEGMVLMSNSILGLSQDVFVEHINGDCLDNQRQNLRIAADQPN